VVSRSCPNHIERIAAPEVLPAVGEPGVLPVERVEPGGEHIRDFVLTDVDTPVPAHEASSPLPQRFCGRFGGRFTRALSRSRRPWLRPNRYVTHEVTTAGTMAGASKSSSRFMYQ
jgi:hypothetical protein